MKKVMVASLLVVSALCAQQSYTLGPDSQPRPDVPKGKVTKHTFTASKLFPGTTRDYFVYVPAQYDATRPACLMIFQDGAGFAAENGAWRVPVVFDNLIHQGAMPVTIGVFIDPGVLTAPSTNKPIRQNRSYEYDALGDRYVRFLLEEILPEVGKNYKLSANPDDRAIAGSSSGAIAAFTAAWERPESFHRVLSFIGSYAHLRGGDAYANLVRKMEPKPMRIFVQDGSNDQSIFAGSWYQSNQSLVGSLEYAGYDFKFVVGTEAHNARHGGSILPDALRWLWRDYPKPITPSRGVNVVRHYITQFLDPQHDWELVGEGYGFTEGPAVDREGNVYFCDVPASRIYKVGADGKPVLFKENTGGASGLMFGGDGRLYAAESTRKRVVAYDAAGKLSVLASGVEANDLAVTSKGAVYFTDLPAQRIWYIDPKGAKKVVYDGKTEGSIRAPNGIRLFPDESLLVVADTLGRTAWSFRVLADGGLDSGQPFYHLQVPDDPTRSGADGMAFDNTGYLYLATKLGVQICDVPGRVVGIMRKPSTADPSNVVFGGKNLDTLYVTAGTQVFRRQLRRKGVLPWEPAAPLPQQ